MTEEIKNVTKIVKFELTNIVKIYNPDQPPWNLLETNIHSAILTVDISDHLPITPMLAVTKNIPVKENNRIRQN